MGTHLKAAISAALLAGACLATASAALAETIRVQTRTDIRSSDPGVNRDAPTDNVILHIVEGLVAYRENGSVGPLLAETVETSEDGRTYTFTLRDGVKFHNGKPLTTAEVLWSWERYLDPATEWRCLSDLDGSSGLKIESIQAPDERTVVFTINEPSALLLDTMARTDCGMGGILHPSSVNEDGTWQAPVGTGPFKLGEWLQGQSITLERFDDYAALEGERDGYTGNKTPLVEEVRFVVVPDPAAAKAALLAGDLDIVPDVSNADQQELEGVEGVTVAVAATAGKNGVLFQTRDELMGNVKLREAIAHAMDAAQIVEAVTAGNAKPNPSIVPTSSRAYSDVHEQGFSYDSEQAKALLQEAGYAGEEIVLLTNQRYASMYDTAVYSQAMLAAADINARLEVLEWGTQLDRYSSGDYQMMAFGYSARLEPALSYEQIMGTKDEQPRKIWDNPKAQALLEEAMQSSDQARRQEIFDELHRMFIADIPMIMLYNGAAIAAYSDKVEGYEPWVANTPRLFGVSISN